MYGKISVYWQRITDVQLEKRYFIFEVPFFQSFKILLLKFYKTRHHTTFFGKIAQPYSNLVKNIV